VRVPAISQSKMSYGISYFRDIIYLSWNICLLRVELDNVLPKHRLHHGTKKYGADELLPLMMSGDSKQQCSDQHLSGDYPIPIPAVYLIINKYIRLANIILPTIL
jgi:hypothetical protein